MNIQGQAALVITNAESMAAALANAAAAHGPARILMNIAGVGTARRIVQKDGSPASPEEFAQLAAHNVTNTHLNGEVIRLDGALRMAPR